MTRRRFAALSWALLALLVGVILWGAYVRATGSGAGCGSHWPLCNGEVVPRSTAAETRIEFVHRLSSGLALAGGLALAWFAFRLFPPASLARRAAALTLALLIAEAAIGAGIVLFGLVADNDSTARAGLMAFHLANTFFLLAAATATALAAGGLDERRWSVFRPPQLLVGLSLAAVVVVGASGAVTALGDTLFPARSVAQGLGRNFSGDSHFLVQLRVLHPLLAIGTAGLILLACHRVTEEFASRDLKSIPTLAVFLVFAQTLAGALNIFLLAPIWLQMLHLLLADLLWISLVALFFLLAARAPATPAATAHGGGT